MPRFILKTICNETPPRAYSLHRPLSPGSHSTVATHPTFCSPLKDSTRDHPPTCSPKADRRAFQLPPAARRILENALSPKRLRGGRGCAAILCYFRTFRNTVTRRYPQQRSAWPLCAQRHVTLPTLLNALCCNSAATVLQQCRNSRPAIPVADACSRERRREADERVLRLLLQI